MAETENQDWQTQFSTANERLEYIYNNSLYSDIEFTVDNENGDKVSLQAKKFILSISSPVFEKMFQGDLAEQGPQIHLPDCTMDGLQEMIRFVYTNVANLTGRNIMEVIYLADKYMLPFLEKRCYEYLAKELTPGEVFHVLPQAQQSKNTRAEELCWNVVDFETLRAVTSKAFLNISRDLLQQVLERETLQTDEINLFKAVDTWASNRLESDNTQEKENGEAKRAIFGEKILKLIRFPVMTQTQFADDVMVCEILKPNEVTEVVQIFSSIEPSQNSFQRIKRKGQWDEMWTENRFTHIEGKYMRISEKPYIIAFEVNKPIFLAGVKLFCVQTLEQVSINLQIERKSSKYEELNKTFILQKCDDSNLYIIELDQPLLLVPMETYTISAVIKSVGREDIPNNSYYCRTLNVYQGTGGKKEINCHDIKIKFNNADDANNPNTTIDFGQFPSFHFKRKIEDPIGSPPEKKQKTID